MNPGDPVSVGIGKPPLDDTLIRATAEEVRITARRAHRVEIALVLIAALLMVVVAGFTGYNTHRLRTVNKNLTDLVETIEANQTAQQSYAEGHATATAESHAALAHNIACMAGYFEAISLSGRDGTPFPDKAALDQCFEATTEAPPDKALPSENKKKK